MWASSLTVMTVPPCLVLLLISSRVNGKNNTGLGVGGLRHKPLCDHHLSLTSPTSPLAFSPTHFASAHWSCLSFECGSAGTAFGPLPGTFFLWMLKILLHCHLLHETHTEHPNRTLSAPSRRLTPLALRYLSP